MQNRRSRSQSFVIHAVIVPCSAGHNFLRVFSFSRQSQELVHCHPRSMGTRTGGTPVVFAKFLKLVTHTFVQQRSHATSSTDTPKQNIVTTALCMARFHLETLSVVEHSIHLCASSPEKIASHITVTAQLYGNSSLQMWTMVCSGPKPLGVYILALLSQFLFSCPFCAQWKASFCSE